uniref:DUF4430 domain-containing protein n=1 Tax=Gouania willdenowi TaxID=441366 RepID=A0A8C5ELR1_GOUWI
MALNVVLSVGVLLLFTPGSRSSEGGTLVPISLTVENDLLNLTPESHTLSVVEGGVLLGALRRLQETQNYFTFTVKENPDFGVWLDSVNGVAGNDVDGTYWELLTESSGEYTRLEVGVGCYVPKPGEHIILRFTSWKTQQ